MKSIRIKLEFFELVDLKEEGFFFGAEFRKITEKGAPPAMGGKKLNVPPYRRHATLLKLLGDAADQLCRL